MTDSANASRNGMGVGGLMAKAGAGWWLKLSLSDGGAVGVALKSVTRNCAEEILNQHLVGKQADDLAASVNHEEEETIGAEKGGEGLGERVVRAEIVELRVNQVGGAGSGLGV